MLSNRVLLNLFTVSLPDHIERWHSTNPGTEIPEYVDVFKEELIQLEYKPGIDFIVIPFADFNFIRQIGEQSLDLYGGHGEG